MDCLQFDTPDTMEFYAHLKQALAQKRLPLSGSLEITFRCNLRCAHCYVGDQRSGDPEQAEMSTAEIERIFDELVDAGCLWLLLTGGEPLVRPDLLQLNRTARRKGFVVSLFTNGTLITPRIADELAEYPPFLTEITLYGYTQATYERVTGIPGSHARCMRGIELLRERGLYVRIKTIAMSLNVHELTDMQNFASQMGLEFRFDPMLVAQLDGGKTPLAVRLSPEEVVKTDLENTKRVEGYKDVYARLGGARSAPNRLYSCLAGQSSFHIDPYGKLTPCMVSRTQSYDLRQGTFEEGWNRFIPEVISQPRQSTSRCDACDLLAICGQCPGWASLENGDPEKSVDYLCRVAHLRAKTFGLKT
jgi:radical SAM protein with 4Fe4S-binding SPASM domain